MAINDGQFQQHLEKALQAQVEERVNAEFDAMKEKVMQQLELRRNEIVAASVLSLMKLVHFSQRTDELVFTIRELPKE
jgi:hypothetical protein